jgi:PhzF family phenazine biosynthesis protein
MTITTSHILRIAAFSDGDAGGNPAGVWIGESLPPADEMQRLAHAVGYSETAFAEPQGKGWRVRYFSPASEVPFCGHATIALGAALARRDGDGVYALALNDGDITVEGRREGGRVAAALQSPPTWSRPAAPELVADALMLFGYHDADLDPRIPPGLAHAGANHLVLALASRDLLAAMRYDQEAGRALMEEARPDDDRAGVGGIPAAFPHAQSIRHRGRLRGPGHGRGHGGTGRLPARPRLAARRRDRRRAGRRHGHAVVIAGRNRSGTGRFDPR